jgi:hypothetical protein
MTRSLLILSLLASGVAASAHAEQTPPAAKEAAVAAAAPQAPAHRNWLNPPLTADQAVELMCPRWNCDVQSFYKTAAARAKATDDRLGATASKTTVARAGSM